jgi:hypothetical protein
MVDLLVPATDGGVAVQFGLVIVAGLIGLLLSRRRPDVRLLVIGLTILLLALMAVRAVH